MSDHIPISVQRAIPAPGGPAEVDNQGILAECTRFALSKAIGNGFWTRKIAKGEVIDIFQDSVKEVLCNEHKVCRRVCPGNILIFFL